MVINRDKHNKFFTIGGSTGSQDTNDSQNQPSGDNNSNTGSSTGSTGGSTTIIYQGGGMTENQSNKLNGIEEGAEKNQDAFSYITIQGATSEEDVTLSADDPTDTFKLAAKNSITLSLEGDVITIGCDGVKYLKELLDVDAENPLDEDLLIYNSETQKWEAINPQFATIEWVNEQFDKIIGSAPEVLDTIYEIAEALGNDPDYVKDIANNLSALTNRVTITEQDITDIKSKLLPTNFTDLTSGQLLQYDGQYWVNVDKDAVGLNEEQLLEYLTANNYAKKSDITWSNLIGKPSIYATNIANITDLNSGWDSLLANAPTAYITRWPNFSEIGSKPTTLVGYGITDGINSITTSGTGNVITGATISGHVLTLSKGITAITSVSLATINDLHANWDAILKVAPTAYVTRWPSWTEVTNKPDWIESDKPSYSWSEITGKPSVFVTNIANITDLHSTWDAVLKAQKPNWLTTVSLATITDLHASWDALLKAAPSVYVTRHPTISEVTGKQSLVIKLNGGTTEGTNMFTYAVTTAKTVNITPSSIGAATLSHTHTLSQISDLHANWDAILKAAPTAHITRWPSWSEVTNKPTWIGSTAPVYNWSDIEDKPTIFTTNIASISDLHSSWDAVLKAQKPAWLTSVSLATISDLNSSWDALLKAAPSAYVTRWPTAAEVGALTQTSADARYLLKSAYTAADVLAKIKTVDGSGSGIDADLLDGQHASSYLRNFNIGNVDFNTLTTSGVYRLANTVTNGASNGPASAEWSQMLVMHGGGDTIAQMAIGYNTRKMYIRSGNPSNVGGSGAWSDWYTIARTIDNVASATKLQTARTINGTSFDGTANITTAKWGTARTLTLTGAVTGSVSIDGSGNVSLATAYSTGSAGPLDGRYALKGGSNATGTWPISITGNAATVTKLALQDTRSVNTAPFAYGKGLVYLFKNNTADGLNDGGTYHSVLHFDQWGESSGGLCKQLALTDGGNMWFRTASSATAWGAWKKLLDSSNYTTYTVTKTGGGASGTWPISITGNAAMLGNYFQVYLFGKNDNGGKPTYILIADVTDWYNATTSTSPEVRHGIRGVVVGERTGNRSGDAIGFINATVAWTKNGGYKLLVDKSDVNIRPRIVLYNGAYYLALYCIGSGFTFRILGSAWGTITQTQLLCTDSSGTVSGLSVVYDTSYYGVGGNAGSASKLLTARQINGTNFDGTANITTAKWGTARNIYIRDASQAHTGTAVSVDGSANEYLLLPSTITATLSGNASTASKWATARTLTLTGDATGSASMDGSANVSMSVNVVDSDKLDGYHETSFFRSNISTLANETITNIPANRSGSYTLTRSGWNGSAFVFYAYSSNSTMAFMIKGGQSANVNLLTTTDSAASKWTDRGVLLTTSNYTSTLDSRYVNISGDTMTGLLTANGGISITADKTLQWFRNTDSITMGFKNTSDGDSDSYFYQTIGDNGNEYFKWQQSISGGSITELMSLKNDALRFKGNVVLHTGNYASTLDTRYVKKAGDTMTGTLTTCTAGTSLYNQGIRINRTALNQWATLTIGYVGTATAGTSASTWLIGTPSSSNSLVFNLNSASESAGLCLKGHGNTDMKWNNQTVWHAGNDGSGSGLDADLLDGYQGTSFDLVTNLTGVADYGMYVVGLLQITDYTTEGNHARGRLVFTRDNGNNSICTIFYNLSTRYNTTNVRFGYLKLGSGGNGISPCTFTYNGKKWAGFTMTSPSNYSHGVQVMRAGLRTCEYSTPFMVRYKTSNTGAVNNSEINNSLVTNGSDIEEAGVTTSTFYGALSGNASTAAQLQTARTIWGQSFNGTANVSGSLSSVTNITMSGYISGFSYLRSKAGDGSRAAYIDAGGFYNIAATGGFAGGLSVRNNANTASIGVTAGAYGTGDSITYYYYGGTGYNSPWMVLKGGNMGVGTTSPSYKLHVVGTGYFSGITTDNYIYTNTGWFQNNKSACGLYNSAVDARWYANGSGWISDKKINATAGLAVTGAASVSGDLTIGSISQILRPGASTSWCNGRDGALIRTTTYPGYNAILSAKTTNGSWQLGTYSNDLFYFTYVTDANYNAGTNTATYNITLPKKSGTIALTSDIPSITDVVTGNAGSSTQGVYVSNNEVKAMSYQLGANVNTGITGRLAYYMGSTNLTNYSATVGSQSKPIYMNQGVPAACTDFHTIPHYGKYYLNSREATYSTVIDNYAFIRSIVRQAEGQLLITVNIPVSVRELSQIFVWGVGRYTHIEPNADGGCYVSIYIINSTQMRVTVHDDASANDGYFYLHFLAIG